MVFPENVMKRNNNEARTAAVPTEVDLVDTKKGEFVDDMDTEDLRDLKQPEISK